MIPLSLSLQNNDITLLRKAVNANNTQAVKQCEWDSLKGQKQSKMCLNFPLKVQRAIFMPTTLSFLSTTFWNICRHTQLNKRSTMMAHLIFNAVSIFIYQCKFSSNTFCLKKVSNWRRHCHRHAAPSPGKVEQQRSSVALCSETQ